MKVAPREVIDVAGNVLLKKVVLREKDFEAKVVAHEGSFPGKKWLCMEEVSVAKAVFE